MQKRLRVFTLAFAALLSVLLLLAGCGQDNQKEGWQSSGRKEQGGPSAFVLQDIYGKTFRMQDYKNKTVLLIFGTTWCPSCRSEIPHFKAIYGRYTPRGLEVVYVNIQESKDKVTRFSNKYQLPYRSVLDISGEVADIYGIRGVPAMVLMKGGEILTQDYRLIDTVLEKLFPQ